MKKYQKYGKIILGTLIIAIVLNLFFANNALYPAGIFGFIMLYHDKVGMNLWFIVLLANVFFLAFGYITLPKRKLCKMLIPFFLLPLFIFLTKDVKALIDLSGVDKLLLTIYGGVLLGIGNRFIYKEGYYVSGSDTIALIEREFPKLKIHIANYALDALIVFLVGYLYDVETALYSLISIIIIEILSKRATVGISDSKVFYIITKKSEEVTKFIIDDMHYELTIFDVKGGFLKTKNKVLMAVIPTSDYYKLKSGVKEIDREAFISITDSYEVINQNRHLKKKRRENI